MNTRSVKSVRIVTVQGKSFEMLLLLPESFTMKRIEDGSGIRRCDCEAKVIFFSKETRNEVLHFLKESEKEPEYYETKNRGRKKGPLPRTYIEWQNLNTLEKPGAFLDILHEIGHSYFPPSKEESFLRWKLDEGKKLSEDEISKYLKLVLGTERKAWAYALRKYRELKKLGIDVFPEAENNEKLFNHIDAALKGYISHFSKTIFGGSKEES